ncbi:MAG: hypothetical protein AMXMBFR23_11100 [Chloroflexota bacterium]
MDTSLPAPEPAHEPMAEADALRRPLLVAAFSAPGNSTAAAALALLAEGRESRILAEIEPDEHYDFTVVRPLVRIEDGERVIDWPVVAFNRIALPERDVVVLTALEPHLRWKAFTRAVVAVAEEYGIREAVLLSAFNGATPHTRPAPLQWFPLSAAVRTWRFGLPPSAPRYQGPATFTMVLATALRDAGIQTGTLNAIAPFYVGLDPSPHAARSLASALASELGVTVDLRALDVQIGEVARQAAQQARESEALATFVANLEQQYDEARAQPAAATEGAAAPAGKHADASLPDAGAVLADVEALLREHRGDAGGGGSGGGGRSRLA